MMLQISHDLYGEPKANHAPAQIFVSIALTSTNNNFRLVYTSDAFNIFFMLGHCAAL